MNQRLKEFFSNIKFNESNWCWEWKNAKIYGYFRLNGKKTVCHKISYQLFIGPIPQGLELDHLCRNMKCCNPEHLEAVTHKENVLRGIGPTAINAQKTHCDNGHEYTPENTFIRPKSGNRDCRICMLSRSRAHHLKNRDKENAKSMKRYNENRDRINARARELWHIKQERRLAGDLLAAERCTVS